jgi:S1-C subfamily serine protease
VEGRLQSLLDEINVPSLFANVVAPTVPALAHGALTTKHFVVSPVGVVAVEASGGCHLINNGTGFVVAPGEVVTAAHLLAGQKLVMVDSMAGRVVLFDPRSDLAVVRVLGLDAAPLSLGSPPSRGTQGDVVGYVTPNDRASSVAVYLGSVVAPGRDIYSGPVFSRTMDVIASPITTSESGSPVLVHGAVVGVVIERAVVDTTLAYAIPVAQLRAQLARVTSATVSTQRCVS